MKTNSLALLIAVMALAGVLVVLFVGFSGKEKLAYVDNGTLVEKYIPIVEARKAFQEKAKLWQANVDTLALQLETELKKYEKDRTAMSDKERKLAEELLNNKQNQFLHYREAIQKKAKEEETNMSRDALNQLNAFIKEYGKQHHYNIIFGANFNGNIIYADDVLDITEEILQGANEAIQRK